MHKYLLFALVAVVLLVSCTEEAVPDPDPVPPADTLTPPTDTVMPPKDSLTPIPRPPKEQPLPKP